MEKTTKTKSYFWYFSMFPERGMRGRKEKKQKEKTVSLEGLLPSQVTGAILFTVVKPITSCSPSPGIPGKPFFTQSSLLHALERLYVRVTNSNHAFLSCCIFMTESSMSSTWVGIFLLVGILLHLVCFYSSSWRKSNTSVKWQIMSSSYFSFYSFLMLHLKYPFKIQLGYRHKILIL